MSGDESRAIGQLMEAVRDGRLSRRDFVRRATVFGLSASAVGAFLAACGGADPTATTTGSGATTARPATTSGATTAAPTRTTSPAGGTATRPASPVPGTATRVTGATGPTSGTIKIYSSLPVNSASKSQISTMINSMRQALEAANNRAGNFQIVYESLDDGSPAKGGEWDAGVEAANAQRAVADADCMAYIGTFNSGAAKVSIPILNRVDLAMISPANTYTGLTKKLEGAVEANEPDVYFPSGRRNYTRVIPSDDLQGAVGANYAREINAKKVYVLDDTELYGHGLAVVFANVAKRAGLEVVGPEGIDKAAADYRSVAQKVRSANADMVYFGGITGNNAGKLWKDLRGVLGRDFKMMGPDGIYEQGFLDAAGAEAEGSYITFGGLPPEKLTGKGADWYRAYKAKYNAEPEGYAAYAYEAMTVTLAAIQQAGVKNRAAIRDAILRTQNWDGVLGRWSFDQNGDTSLTSMSVLQVKGSKFEFVKAVEAPRS